MQPTHRFWATVGVGLVPLAAAVVFARPLLIVPGAAVFAYLLAVQVAFVVALDRFDATLSVSQSFDRRTTAVDEPATLSLSADAETGPLDVTYSPCFSPGLVGERPESDLDEPITVQVRSPVAGTHRALPPEFHLRDPTGLFAEKLVEGPASQVRVEPRRPDRVHVGEGGDTRIGAFGEHESALAEGGISPAEVREYVPVEPATQIDWKTTARLSSLHVREFEGTTDLVTELLVDVRSGLDVGPEGETAMTYLRDAALRYLAGVRSIGDPVGCYTVEDEGVSQLASAKSSQQHYDQVRRYLVDLVTSSGAERRRRDPPVAARSHQFDRSTPFGRTLASFAAARPAVVESPTPLVAAVRQATAGRRGEVQIALFTDDADRAAVREAVMAARRADALAYLFLAPRVLFEPGALADLNHARQRYLEFEEFRRSLARLDGVRAFEVAPRDRFETVTEAAAATHS